MLSPTVPSQPTVGTPTSQAPTTRRRGLSYLRSLSSHNSSTTTTTEQPRPSPRNFFQRSTSYNNDTKSKPAPATGRRRSVSRPNEPTSPQERPILTRVLSAGNSPIPSPIPPAEDISSGEDSRAARSEERLPEATQTTTTLSDTMARNSRPSTPRRVTDSALNSTNEHSRAHTGARVSSTTISNGTTSTPNISSTSGRGSGEEEQGQKSKPPMIRFFPHQELRSNSRQSLNFAPVSRVLPSESSIIRVGRYSEREGPPVANPTYPSDAPVGFKSKVVSRKHCEFSFVEGQWQIRDVGSSSGTFLNHIRLSQPNSESRLFPIKDGDIVQLGIDFRGGEEMIFRCVKIRIECNRSWQKKPNNFNKNRQAQLLGLTKDQPTGGQNNGECSICLGSVLPCQALFVAPCAHVWHYKCIRPMIEGRTAQYPSFQCPNCRAWTDLEADVDVAEDEMSEWVEVGGDTDDLVDVDQTERPQTAENDSSAQGPATATAISAPAVSADTTAPMTSADQAVLEQANNQPASPAGSGLLSRRPGAAAGTTEGPAINGIAMPARPSDEELGQQLSLQRTTTETPNGEQVAAAEGPLTPRNNAGPFVFDGSGGSGENRRRTLFVPGLFEVAENAAS